MNSLFAMPREWLEATGEIGRFTGTIVRDVYGLRVFRFFGESLRQCGILIVGSTTIIWTLMFILGLQCGIEGAYFLEAQGAPAYSGVFTAWCDLREIIPYAFGYMMAAKVGTGIVAELGAMRISDEIDALEVMGISGMTFLCATRLLAAWLVLPFMYLAATSSNLLLILAAIGIVMGAFGQVTVNDAMVGKYTSEEWRSRAYSVRYFLGFTAAGVSVWLVAWLYEQGGFVTMLHAFSALCLLVIAAAIILPTEIKVPAADASHP